MLSTAVIEFRPNDDSENTHAADFERFKTTQKFQYISLERLDIPGQRALFQVMPVKTLPQYLPREYKGRANSLEKYPYRHKNLVPEHNGVVLLFSHAKELLFVSRTTMTLRRAVQQLINKCTDSGYKDSPNYRRVWEQVGVGYIGWNITRYSEDGIGQNYSHAQFVNSLPVRFRQPTASRDGGAMCCPPD